MNKKNIMVGNYGNLDGKSVDGQHQQSHETWRQIARESIDADEGQLVLL